MEEYVRKLLTEEMESLEQYIVSKSVQVDSFRKRLKDDEEKLERLKENLNQVKKALSV